MLRCAVWLVVVLCAFAPSASAERITIKQQLLDTEIDLTALDPSVEAAILAASGWGETPGADVWWVSLEDMRLMVKVFSTLQRPGNGEPQCCLQFTVDDAEFWLKLHAGLRPGKSPLHGGTSPEEDSPRTDVDLFPNEPDFSTPGAQASGGTPQGDNAVGQVPEPHLLFLFGLGFAAARRRLRRPCSQ